MRICVSNLEYLTIGGRKGAEGTERIANYGRLRPVCYQIGLARINGKNYTENKLVKSKNGARPNIRERSENERL